MKNLTIIAIIIISLFNFSCSNKQGPKAERVMVSVKMKNRVSWSNTIFKKDSKQFLKRMEILKKNKSVDTIKITQWGVKDGEVKIITPNNINGAYGFIFKKVVKEFKLTGNLEKDIELNAPSPNIGD